MKSVIFAVLTGAAGALAVAWLLVETGWLYGWVWN